MDKGYSPSTMQLIPRLSEKSYQSVENQNIYIFDVPMSANKLNVKKAVEQQFKVAVDSVNIHIVKGKSVNTFSKTAGQIKGKRSDKKRAFVKLKKGDKIPIFEGA